MDRTVEHFPIAEASDMAAGDSRNPEKTLDRVFLSLFNYLKRGVGLDVLFSMLCRRELGTIFYIADSMYWLTNKFIGITRLLLWVAHCVKEKLDSIMCPMRIRLDHNLILTSHLASSRVGSCEGACSPFSFSK